MAARGKKAAGSFDDTEVVAAGDLLHGCIVRPLGYNVDTYFVADSVGQLRALRPRDLQSPSVILSLFHGDDTWLRSECPTDSRRAKSGQSRVAWHNSSAEGRIMRACVREGFFDPAEQTRGPGIWPFTAELMVGEEFAGSEQLIIHTGDRVGIVGYDAAGTIVDWHPAGCKLGAFFYPAGAPSPAPGDDPAREDEIEALLALFGRWPWLDGATVHQLLLGSVCAQIIPAALPYRPGAWLQGRSGSGKSSTINLFELLSQGRALRYENATAAGVREDFRGNAARPVYINEAETSEDNRRIQALIEMMRHGYDEHEGRFRRAGSMGGAGKPKTIFLFAAVEPPPLLPQDANRIAMLRLGKLAVDSAQMERFDEEMPAFARRLAPRLARRVVDVYPLFPQAFNAFRKGLLAHDHTPRSANTFGVLLALAHIVQFAMPPDDSDVDEWAVKLDAKLLASREDHQSSEELCLTHLCTTLVAPFRSSEQTPLGEFVRKALHEKDDLSLEALQKFGVNIVERTVAGQREVWVAIANMHNGLDGIFKGTRWQGRAWSAPLRQLEGACASPTPVRFAGRASRATLLPPALFPKAAARPLLSNQFDSLEEDAHG